MAVSDARDRTGVRRAGRLGLLALFVLLLLAVGARLVALQLDGHSGDVLIVHRWAERLAERGPWGFYDGTLSVYPALLYVYWPLGLLLNGDALDMAIKGLSIPFDLGLGLLLFIIVRPRAGDGVALAAAGLYLLNPGVLIAGPLWGQIDAAGTLVFVATLVALARRSWMAAGALAVLAGMTKPQFGLVVLPLVVVAWMTWRSGGGRRPLLRAAGGALLTYVVVSGPLLLDPLRYADQLYEVARIKPDVSLYAPNPWGLLVGFEVPDTGWIWIGAGLLLGGLVMAMLPLRRRSDLPTLLAVGALIVFAFYFLPTRAHERYLFPAIALLAPFAAVSFRSLAAYVILSLAFAASLLFSLAVIAPGVVPGWLADALRSTPAIWAMGLALAGSAVTLIQLIFAEARERLSAPRASPT